MTINKTDLIEYNLPCSSFLKILLLGLDFDCMDEIFSKNIFSSHPYLWPVELLQPTAELVRYDRLVVVVVANCSVVVVANCFVVDVAVANCFVVAVNDSVVDAAASDSVVRIDSDVVVDCVAVAVVVAVATVVVEHRYARVRSDSARAPLAVGW